ncbi:MAG: hypothetical protein V3U56_07095 [Syntrophobacteria bacterium]
MENSKAIFWISATLLVGLSAFPYLVWTVPAASKMEHTSGTGQGVRRTQQLACTGCPLLLFDNDLFTVSKTEAKAETKQVVLEVRNMTCSL